MKIAMFVFNSGNNDLRVHRQAELLGKEGHAVRVYCFLQPGLPEREEREHYAVVREDQRSRLSRFFDDRLMARLKRPKPERAEAVIGGLEVVQRDDPQRPCRPPEPRELPELSTAAERSHRDYIRRINQIWARQATAWGAQVCHAHDVDALEAALLASQELGARLVYDAHELWSEQPFLRSRESVTYWDRLEGELVTRADAVLTVNEPLARELEKRYGLDKVVPLHNCQDFQEVDESRRRRLRRRASGRPVALYQGAYAPDRGLEQVILSTAHQDEVAVALRGFGEREASLRWLAREHGDRVLFLDPVPAEDIVDAAAEADIGLIPFLPTCLNHYLSTPNKLFEYMAAGLAVAGADLPEVRKFVDGEDLGNLFDPYCPRDIARALVELAHSGRLEEMGERGRVACRERYNWEREGRKLLEVYRRWS